MSDGLIDNFKRFRLPGDGVPIDVLVGGSGPPLLLLHGYPQTRVCWSAMAPQLARRFTVVIPDLRGYGRSGKPPGGAAHECYSKRAMARDQVSVMKALGHERFAVAGHDRGARVAYRLAFDHPAQVSHVAILDVLPTAYMWEQMDAQAAFDNWHWLFLAQPAPVPETLIAADPTFQVRNALSSWAAPGFRFDERHVADYVRCHSDPASIHATCEDYRASWHVDRHIDALDQRAGNRIEPPLLVIWGDKSGLAPHNVTDVWSRWARNVSGAKVTGGHFSPEEAPLETLAALEPFLQHSAHR